MSKKYDGYDWIKVKKYVPDETATWEERYKQLSAHHFAETTFLIEEVRKLAKKVEEQDRDLRVWGVSECLRKERDRQADLDRRFN